MWLTADLTDCEEINCNNKFSEMKILYYKRTITPLGKIAILKYLILSKIVQLWMLLPNPPDVFFFFFFFFFYKCFKVKVQGF